MQKYLHLVQVRGTAVSIGCVARASASFGGFLGKQLSFDAEAVPCDFSSSSLPDAAAEELRWPKLFVTLLGENSTVKQVNATVVKSSAFTAFSYPAEAFSGFVLETKNSCPGRLLRIQNIVVEGEGA